MATRKSEPEKAQAHVESAEAKLESAEAEVVAAHAERAEVEQAAAEVGQAAVVEERIEALREAAAPDESRVGYTVGAWNGRPHYRSNDGRFDTFDEGAMRRYVRTAGRPTAAQLRRETV